ncbi:MAG: uroporphyrinogen-III C-methyltransferase [Candidatus Omnitrophica bacterium]|nr:uroporphyrinogen-III C-methyltransferase [Candidatus Omnitrophota bacterium]MCM8802604.1 uroporphyrinogen-III C-methyltransferase [Candidatus Omnitrophota bacterium]
MKTGKVYLVGAGPGEHDLITLKGMKILQQADVVIYDYLVDRSILKYAKPESEIICADELSSGIYNNGFTKRQDLINRLMVKKAKEGKNVVRLKNGDPFIFGRANEELGTLVKNKIEFSVIPGVSAVNAGSCFSGIPLTVRGISSSVVITTGHEAEEKNKGFVDWNKIANIDTIVLYMAVENLSYIVQKLIAAGLKKTMPIAVISNISKICQKSIVGTLKDIVKKVEKEKISPPAIVIIGDVVKKEKRFNWFRRAKKILFTGISSERFFKKGIIFHIPMIEIRPLDDYTEMDNWIKKISIFDWIVFTSRFGVYYFFDRLFRLGYDSRILSGIKIAAIGSSTANKLKEYGIIADLVPINECSDGLIQEIKSKNIKGKKIFLPRSDIADKGLTERLRDLEAEVYPCVAYKNVMPDDLPDIDLNFFDEIIFTSPSTVRNFIKRYGKIPKKVKIRSIGWVTQKEIEKWKL